MFFLKTAPKKGKEVFPHPSIAPLSDDAAPQGGRLGIPHPVPAWVLRIRRDGSEAVPA
eukprot:COSAG06_NODE_23060_length_703_cov_9.289735_1_plen_57_part_10